MLRRRKMVRSFDRSRPVPPESLDRVMASVLHAPSAGFTQGNEFLVLDDPDAAAEFWRLIDDPSEPYSDEQHAMLAPVIVIPLPNREAYTSRYSEGEARHGLQESEAWPVPFWDTDAAMAAMCMLLAAVDEGLGAFYFGIGHGEDAVRARFGIPPQFRPVGVVALGYAAPADPLSSGSSGRTRRRRTVEELVHRNGW